MGLLGFFTHNCVFSYASPWRACHPRYAAPAQQAYSVQATLHARTYTPPTLEDVEPLPTQTQPVYAVYPHEEGVEGEHAEPSRSAGSTARITTW